MVNGEGRRVLFFILASAFCILHSRAARANDLTVDRSTLRVGETLSITVSLEDDFAGVDFLTVPVQNLTIEDRPAVSRQFAFINGAVVRRKVFRFVARANAPGAAMVGPLVVDGEGGRRETLPAIALQVIPDAAAASNDPRAILRELLATGRDPFFVVAEIDRGEAWVGEEVVVTWVLYNAASVQDWRIGKVPKLEDFWSEELEVRGEQPTQVIVDDRVLQKLPVRRVAIYPLRAGRLSIAGMEIVGTLLRRIDTGPFGLFEGALIDARYQSAPLTIDVRPLPPGPPVDAVGDVRIVCGAPSQKSGGPVVFDVALAGRANLRGAPAPRLAGPVDGDVQVEEGRLAIERRADGASMSRRWKYVIFPAREGRMQIPPLVETVFVPAAAERRTLRCEGSTLQVSTAAAPVQPAPGGRAPLVMPVRRVVPWIAGGLLTAILIAFAAPRLARQQRIRRAARALARGRSPAEVRDAVLAMLAGQELDPAALLAEPTERGEAYRALRSLLDAALRDRVQAADAAPEIELRVREFVQLL